MFTAEPERADSGAYRRDDGAAEPTFCTIGATFHHAEQERGDALRRAPSPARPIDHAPPPTTPSTSPIIGAGLAATTPEHHHRARPAPS